MNETWDDSNENGRTGEEEEADRETGQGRPWWTWSFGGRTNVAVAAVAAWRSGSARRSPISLSLSLKSAVDRGRSSGRFGGAGRSRRLPRAPAFLCGTEHSNRSEVETKMKRRTKKKRKPFCDY